MWFWVHANAIAEFVKHIVCHVGIILIKALCILLTNMDSKRVLNNTNRVMFSAFNGDILVFAAIICVEILLLLYFTLRYVTSEYSFSDASENPTI